MCFKGSIYTFLFFGYVHFLINFLAYIEVTCISCYTFSERFTFIVFNVDKIASKYFKEEEHRQSENEGFEGFERVIFLLL